MSLRTFSALVLFAGLAVASMIVPRFTPTSAARQDAHPPATSSPAPVFLRWPLPATAKAYSTIDGTRLWQYVQEHGDIAERYRQQGHPQFWGIIAGTFGDADESQWLLGKYKQIGLADTHIQTVALFHPQWAPESWEIVATGDGASTPLTSAQPAYATTATNGTPLDVPAVYVGLGSEAARCT